MNKRVVKLDVREDIRAGREPFLRIMAAVAALKADQDLLLIAPFEPAPLYAVLRRQGFVAQPKPTADGDWEVRFTRSSASVVEPVTRASDSPAGGRACAGTPVVEVDARGLEPPQPLITILEALASLPEGAVLRARTDRRPMHLYPELESRGFHGESEEQPDGSFVTYVRRP